MPRIIRREEYNPRKKNDNFKGGGKKGISGRKTKAEEMEKFKERLEEEALVNFANKIIFKRLKKLDEQDNFIGDIKIALPITLKGMTEKKDIKGDLTINDVLNQLDGND